MIADTPKNVKAVRGVFDLSDKIGNYKIERNKFLINSEIKCNDNELPKIDRINVREHNINNEYDNQELLSIMKDKNISSSRVSYLELVRHRLVKIIRILYSYHHITNYAKI